LPQRVGEVLDRPTIPKYLALLCNEAARRSELEELEWPLSKREIAVSIFPESDSSGGPDQLNLCKDIHWYSRGNMGWSFQEQISCQIVDVTKPWRANPGHEHRFKGCFHENTKFIAYHSNSGNMLSIQNDARLFSTRNLSQPTLF